MVNLSQFALSIEPMEGPDTCVGPASVAKLGMVNILALPQCEPHTRGQYWPQITVDFDRSYFKLLLLGFCYFGCIIKIA